MNKPLSHKLAKITGCKQYINWYSVSLGLSRGLCTFGCKLAKMLKSEGIGTSKQPQSTAAGCLWSVCQALRPDISKEDVASITGVSQATINDVERIMDDTEKIALASIFAEDICDLNHILNKSTRHKIVLVAKAVSRIIFNNEENEERKIWSISAFAVYFVLIINDIDFNEAQMLLSSNMTKEALLDLTKQMMPYRDSIIDQCIGTVYRSLDTSLNFGIFDDFG